MLDSLANELKDNVAARTAVEAISKHYLSQLADAVLRWIIAKIDVRKIVLQGSKNPYAMDLLQSNVWEPTIFAKSAVNSLIENNIPRKEIEERLDINSETSKFYHRFPARVHSNRLLKKPKSQRNESQFFRNKHSPIHYSNTTQNTPKFNFKNKQFQDNSNSWGTRNQKAESAPQNQKHNKKPWNKPKHNAKGRSGFTGFPKGKRNAQQ